MKTYNPTPRELEVAELTAFGATEKEVAYHMHLSVETVKVHKKNFFYKTGCRNIADMTRWYLQYKFKLSFDIRPRILGRLAFTMLAVVIFAEFSRMPVIRTRSPRPITASCRPVTRRVKKEAYELQFAFA